MPQHKTHHKKQLQDKATGRDFLLAIVALVGVVAIVAYLLWRFSPTQLIQKPIGGQTEYEAMINKKADDMSCVTKTQVIKPSENYLSPRIKTAQVEIMTDYYKCNPVRRDDAVVYFNAGEGNLGVEIKGIPHDKIRLEQAKDAKNVWNIIVNDVIVVNSEKKPYKLTERGFNTLGSYVKAYNGIVPENAVLGLFDNPEAVLLPGFVSYTDFVGKIKE